jgi:hypothetical protein
MKKILCAWVFLVGCFDSSVINNVTFKCSDTKPGCPLNKICVIQQGALNNEGTCESLDYLLNPTTDLSSVIIKSDLTMPPPIDMRPPPDFTVPPDLSFPSTCAAGGGVSLGDGSFACQGTWNFTASKLCKQKVCVNIGASAKNICDNLSGFYFGDIGGSVDYATGSVFECATRSGGAPIFYGCGKWGTPSTISCKGFTNYLKCIAASDFTCVADISTIDNSISTRPQTGVICCP